MNEERKLQKSKIALMRNPKFALLSGILMVGKTKVVDGLPTACTNGRDEMYGREFVKSLSDRELNFLVAHEGYHKMYRHMTTWRKLHDEDHNLANQACDYVINIQLYDLDPHELVIAMPRYTEGPRKGERMGLCEERFRGMNAKQVFDILKQEKKEGGGQGDGDGDGGQGGGGGGGGLDDHDWAGAKSMTDADKKELLKEIDQAIRQGIMAHQKIAGTGAGGIDRELEDLLEPKVDWREVLREFVKATCNAKDASSWRRPNRRFLSTGVYMPSMIGEKVGHLVVAIDTSGSIGGNELAEFLSEVKGIAEEVSPEVVDLLYWDSAVAGHEVYESSAVSSITQSTKPRGGGGTSPSCVSAYLKEKNIKPECIIMLSDGYVGNDWGSDWTAEVLWCIVGGNDVCAPNGKTIHVKD
jgi:predicted metal-dependent peptidase